MSNKSISLEALKSHLFEAIEGVKNLSDDEASLNEKMSIEQAKAVVDISGKVIDIYKVQLEAFGALKNVANFGQACNAIGALGVVDDQTIKQLEA